MVILYITQIWMVSIHTRTQVYQIATNKMKKNCFINLANQSYCKNFNLTFRMSENFRLEVNKMKIKILKLITCMIWKKMFSVSFAIIDVLYSTSILINFWLFLLGVGFFVTEYLTDYLSGQQTSAKHIVNVFECRYYCYVNIFECIAGGKLMDLM